MKIPPVHWPHKSLICQHLFCSFLLMLNFFSTIPQSHFILSSSSHLHELERVPSWLLIHHKILFAIFNRHSTYYKITEVKVLNWVPVQLSLFKALIYSMKDVFSRHHLSKEQYKGSCGSMIPTNFTILSVAIWRSIYELMGLTFLRTY